MAYNFVSNRNSLVEEAGNQVLQLDFPKGCLGKVCNTLATIFVVCGLAYSDRVDLLAEGLFVTWLVNSPPHKLRACAGVCYGCEG